MRSIQLDTSWQIYRGSVSPILNPHQPPIRMSETKGPKFCGPHLKFKAQAGKFFWLHFKKKCGSASDNLLNKSKLIVNVS